MTSTSPGPNDFGPHPLPAHPDLQQQKTRAKELLKAWRAGVPEALERLRAHHQRYRDGDGIDPGDLRLTDAQHVLAREYGFASWPRFRVHVNQLRSGQRNDEILEFVRAVTVGDSDDVRNQLQANPQPATQDVAEDNEHRGLHFAVRQRDAAMVELLLEHGADPDQGVYPRREATTPRALAHDRGYDEITRLFEEKDEALRQEARCPNLTVTPAIAELSGFVEEGEDDAILARIEADSSLIDSCDDNGETVVHHAARWGRVALLKRLIAAGAHLNKMNVDGIGAVDIAVRMPGNDSLREACVQAGQILLAQPGIIVSLETAVALGDLARVRQCAEREPERFRPDVKRECRLLSIAVQHDQTEALKLLLELGCDPDDRHQKLEYPGEVFSWGGPLWLAAGDSKYEVASLLLEAGADPNGSNYASGDPVSQAYNNQDRKMLDLLFGRGGTVDIDTAALEGDAEQCFRLLNQGQGGPRLINAAICGGNPVIVERLLAAMELAEIEERSYTLLTECMRFWRISPFRRHRDFDTGNYFTIAEMLLDAGVDPNGRGRWNYTPLHEVAFVGNCWGQLLSSAEDRVRFATLLLDRGARLNVRDDEIMSTPLAWAARWNRIELVELFLERGAKVRLPDDEPWATPLAWAERHGSEEAAARLRQAAGRKA